MPASPSQPGSGLLEAAADRRGQVQGLAAAGPLGPHLGPEAVGEGVEVGGAELVALGVDARAR